MTIQQWQNYFNIIQDKYGSPYFTNPELSAIFNRALVQYTAQYFNVVPNSPINIGIDRDAIASFSPLIYELAPLYMDFNGRITKASVESALFSVVPSPIILGQLNGGGGYTNGVYTNVTMAWVSGPTLITPMVCTITVAGGVVTNVVYVSGGAGATYGTVVTAVGMGSGSGFTLNIQSGATLWRELSIKNVLGLVTTPVNYSRHNDWAQFLNNSFKTPTNSNPKVYETALDYRFLPINPAAQIGFICLKYPVTVDIDLGISSDLPDFTHDKVLALALDLAGIASRDTALMELKSIKKVEI